MKLVFLSIIAFVVLNSFSYGQTKPKTPPVNNPEILTNSAVIALHKAGLGDEIIISKIETSKTQFDVSTDRLIELKAAGVSSVVIKSLLDKTNGISKPLSHSVEVTKTPDKAPNKASDKPVLEMLFHPYYFDKSTTSYKPLEKSVASIRTKQKAFGYGGSDIMIEVDGKNSSAHIAVTDSLSFFINTNGGQLPDFTLYKLKIDGNKRNAVGMEARIFGGSKAPKNVIPFNIVAGSNGLYKIVVPQKLTEGEYFFTGKVGTGSNAIDAYTFQIN